MRLVRLGVAGLLTVALAASVLVAPASSAPAAPGAHRTRLGAELAAAYRSRISSIRARLDYYPDRERVRGQAVLHLRLRPGETRILFHFNPLRYVSQAQEQKMIRSLRLDGRRLDPQNPADLRRIHSLPTAEASFELQRNLRPGSRHTLRVTWSAPVPRARPGWYFQDFDDTEGPLNQNETAWPTISSPEVQARHRILLRVHSAAPYVVTGSGSVRPTAAGPGVQSWRIDTGRRVASHTVFFAAVPAAEVQVASLAVHGVPVTIVSNQSSAITARAERIATRTITNLIRDLGPFPVPSLHVLLTGWGSGMEFYGATRTGIGALHHEIGHMYFGTTAVNRTWRDTWFDEAAVVWWLAHRSLRPVPDGFRSNLARGRRTAVAPGFDQAAYGDGARVLARVARDLGGTRAMLDFLADLHRRRDFRPFTTEDFINDVVRAQGGHGRAELDRWLLGGAVRERSGAKADMSEHVGTGAR